MSKKIRLVVSIVLTLALMLSLAFTVFASNSGRLWTTDSSGGAQDQNSYASKQDVYINAEGLPNGDYFVRVFQTSGNTLLATSTSANVQVVNNGFSVVHLWSKVNFGDSSNNEYKVEIYQLQWNENKQKFEETNNKTDNFKVEVTPPTDPTTTEATTTEATTTEATTTEATTTEATTTEATTTEATTTEATTTEATTTEATTTEATTTEATTTEATTTEATTTEQTTTQQTTTQQTTTQATTTQATTTQATTTQQTTTQATTTLATTTQATTTEATTEITEETIPQGGETTPEITEESIPEGPAALPKTGGIPAGILFGAGVALSSVGLLVRRFKK